MPHTSETGTPTDSTDTVSPTGDGFCAVRQVFDAECVGCHASEAPLGDLDLQTDPYAAVVGVTSKVYDEVLVTPGDPDGSLLFRKMDDAMRAGEGGVMPPSGELGDAVEIVLAWISAGASASCDDPSPTPILYHPARWADADAHGMATKFQSDADCRTCHGAELDGGTAAVSCDGCHAAGWRTDCTYCHGGTTDASGAPPEDLDDNTKADTTTFPPHDAHGAGRISPEYGCGSCHPTQTGLFDAGHVFDDDTPGEAEVVLGTGTYVVRTCADTYCHSNDVDVGAGATTCRSCHGGVGSPPAELQTMSPGHPPHLGAALACSECHPDATGSDRISDPARHVQGLVDLAFPTGIVRAPGTGSCTGTCHGHDHVDAPW